MAAREERKRVDFYLPEKLDHGVIFEYTFTCDDSCKENFRFYLQDDKGHNVVLLLQYMFYKKMWLFNSKESGQWGEDLVYDTYHLLPTTDYTMTITLESQAFITTLDSLILAILPKRMSTEKICKLLIRGPVFINYVAYKDKFGVLHTFLGNFMEKMKSFKVDKKKQITSGSISAVSRKKVKHRISEVHIRLDSEVEDDAPLLVRAEKSFKHLDHFIKAATSCMSVQHKHHDGSDEESGTTTTSSSELSKAESLESTTESMELSQLYAEKEPNKELRNILSERIPVSEMSFLSAQTGPKTDLPEEAKKADLAEEKPKADSTTSFIPAETLDLRKRREDVKADERNNLAAKSNNDQYPTLAQPFPVPPRRKLVHRKPERIPSPSLVICSPGPPPIHMTLDREELFRLSQKLSSILPSNDVTDESKNLEDSTPEDEKKEVKQSLAEDSLPADEKKDAKQNPDAIADTETPLLMQTSGKEENANKDGKAESSKKAKKDEDSHSNAKSDNPQSLGSTGTDDEVPWCVIM